MFTIWLMVGVSLALLVMAVVVASKGKDKNADH